MSIKTQVRYFNEEWRGSDEIPTISSRETRRAVTSFKNVVVNDVRRERASMDIDGAGFTLIDVDEVGIDPADEAVVKSVYVPQMAASLAKLVGADEVLFSNYQVRTEKPEGFNDAYARFVHTDYHRDTVQDMSTDLVVKMGGAPSSEWQYAWYNTWQPFDHAVERNPLAVIDAESIAEGDIIPYYYAGFKTPNLTAAPVYNSAHKWCYFGGMKTTEALVLKQADTRPARTEAVPHTSFDDPDTRDDALPRRSIELRLMAVFKRAT